MKYDKNKILAGRHGDIDKVDDDIAHGQTKDPLNEEGEQQAMELGVGWKNKGIDCIYCSDLPRAKETADIASKIIGSDVETRKELRTWDIGKFDGKDKSEVDDLLQMYRENPGSKVPGGESYGDFSDRVMKGLHEYNDKGAAFVLHNEILKLLGEDNMEPGESKVISLKHSKEKSQ